MALVAKSFGWQKNNETGNEEFLVVLKAQSQDDVPSLTFGDLIEKVPLLIVRQEAPNER